MDLPRLMISAAQGTSESLIEQQIKSVSLSEEDMQKKKYNVRMILDPEKEEIRFEPKAWQEGDEKKYYYLGNNARPAKQIYVVRE